MKRIWLVLALTVVRALLLNSLGGVDLPWPSRAGLLCGAGGRCASAPLCLGRAGAGPTRRPCTPRRSTRCRVYAPPMYSTAYPSPSVYSAALFTRGAGLCRGSRRPVVTPRRVYYPGEPIRNAVKFVVP